MAELIFLRLFKDKSAAQRYLKDDCIECESKTDVSFRMVFDVSDRVPFEQDLSLIVMYQVGNQQVFVSDNADAVNPEISGDKIPSTIDLPGVTLIARAQNGLFKKLTLISLTIQTDRGQTIRIENPTMVRPNNNEIAFEYVFPDSTQH